MRRLAPLVASIALHLGAGAVAGVVVPGALARAQVIPVELVVIDPPAPVEPAPAPKRITPPKPIVTPLPKLEPPPDVARPMRAPAPAPHRAAPPPEPAPTPAAAPTDAASSTVASTPPTSAPSPSPAGPGLSLVDSTPAPASAPSTGPAVASIPRDTPLTTVARPTGGYQVRPAYPATARRLGVQGTTLLRVHVLDDGRVDAVDVEESAGHPDLDQAAADAVRRWRFEPARRGNDAVAMWVRLPVQFRLK